MYNKLVKELRYLDEYSKRINPTPSGIFRDAADAIEELCGLAASQSKDCSEAVAKYLELWAKQPRWNPVTEDSPKEGVPVLGAFKFQGGNGCIVTERMTINGEEIWNAAMGMKPFAWMPSPEPPKEET